MSKTTIENENSATPHELQMAVQELGRALYLMGCVNLDGPSQVSTFYLNAALGHLTDVEMLLIKLRDIEKEREEG